MWCAIRRGSASRVRSASRYCVSPSRRRSIFLHLESTAATRTAQSITNRALPVHPAPLDPVLPVALAVLFPVFPQISIRYVRRDAVRAVVAAADPAAARADRAADHAADHAFPTERAVDPVDHVKPAFVFVLYSTSTTASNAIARWMILFSCLPKLYLSTVLCTLPPASCQGEHSDCTCFDT